MANNPLCDEEFDQALLMMPTPPSLPTELVKPNIVSNTKPIDIKRRNATEFPLKRDDKITEESKFMSAQFNMRT